MEDSRTITTSSLDLMRPLILITATALVVAIALVATVIPAARATRVDPMLALRSE